MKKYIYILLLGVIFVISGCHTNRADKNLIVEDITGSSYGTIKITTSNDPTHRKAWITRNYESFTIEAPNGWTTSGDSLCILNLGKLTKEEYLYITKIRNRQFYGK